MFGENKRAVKEKSFPQAGFGKKILREVPFSLAIFLLICYTVGMKENNRRPADIHTDAPEVIAPELPKTPELPVRTADRERPSRPGTRYRFRFPALTLVVLVAGLALCLAAIGLTSWQFVGFLRGGNLASLLEWLKYILLYGVSAALAVLVAAMLLRSEYILTDRDLTLAFGLLRTRYPLEEIASVHLFKGAGKLVVYFKDEQTKYMAIVIRPSLYETFVRDITSRREQIAFSFSTAEEEEQFKKKK